MDFGEEEEQKEIYHGVADDFDLDESVKLSVWVAKWFVESMGVPLDKALKSFEITKEQYDKWKDHE